MSFSPVATQRTCRLWAICTHPRHSHSPSRLESWHFWTSSYHINSDFFWISLHCRYHWLIATWSAFIIGMCFIVWCVLKLRNHHMLMDGSSPHIRCAKGLESIYNSLVEGENQGRSLDVRKPFQCTGAGRIYTSEEGTQFSQQSSRPTNLDSSRRFLFSGYNAV